MTDSQLNLQLATSGEGNPAAAFHAPPQLDRLSLAEEAARALMAELSLPDLLNAATALAPRLGARDSYVILREPRGGLRFKSSLSNLEELDEATKQEFLRTVTQRGLERWVLDTGQPALVTDSLANERWYQAPHCESQPPARSVVAAPLHGPRHGLIGVLAYLHDAPAQFDEDDLRLVKLIARYLAAAVENAWLMEAERRRAAEAESVGCVLHLLNSHFDLTDAFPKVALQLRALTGCDRVGMTTLDLPTRSVVLAALDSSIPAFAPGARWPLADTFAGEKILAGQPHVTADLSAEKGFPIEMALLEAGYRSRVVIPMSVGQRVSGTLGLVWKKADGPEPAHIPLLTQIAGALALALERSRLFESVALERSRMELVAIMSQELLGDLQPWAVAEKALRLVSNAMDTFAGPVAATAIFVVVPGTDRLKPLAAADVSHDRIDELDRAADLRLGRGLAGWAAQHRQIAIAGNVADDERWVFVPGLDDGIRSAASVPLMAGEELVGVMNLHSRAPGTFTPEHLPLLLALSAPLALALQNARFFELERSRVRDLTIRTEVSRELTRSMDLNDLLPAAASHLARLVEATSAVILLWDAEGRRLTPAAAFGPPERSPGASAYGPDEITIANVVVRTGQPEVVEDTRHSPLAPAQPAARQALLAVPLIARGRPVGAAVIAEARRPRRFSSEEIDRAASLAAQIALAIDNAQLFASLGKQLSQTIEMKQLRDNVFASIAAGVITTDALGRITLVNGAAERILNSTAAGLIGQPAEQSPLAALGEAMMAAAREVRRGGRSDLDREVTAVIPGRGMTHLNVSITPLRDSEGAASGLTFVIEDMTRQRQLELEHALIRRTFERVVAPKVAEALLANATNLHLGGKRQEITAFFADVRGFTAFAEHTAPEALVEVLNAFLTVATEAVLEQGGTLDKFMGDAVMAIFNAPLPQPEHTLRAVRAAVNMREVLMPHRHLLDSTFPLNFSVGIAIGEAVVGNIGTPDLFNYTAVGDTVNLAKRLQESAGPGQILLNQAAYDLVNDHIRVRALPPLKMKGRQAEEQVFEVLGLN